MDEVKQMKAQMTKLKVNLMQVSKLIQSAGDSNNLNDMYENLNRVYSDFMQVHCEYIELVTSDDRFKDHIVVNGLNLDEYLAKSKEIYEMAKEAIVDLKN